MTAPQIETTKSVRASRAPVTRTDHACELDNVAVARPSAGNVSSKI
jgi:hypothetical protein